MNLTNNNVSDSLLEQALNAIPDGAVIADMQRNVLYHNKAFVDMTGYSNAEIVGRNIDFIISALTDPITVQKIQDIVQADQIFRGEITNYREDGSQIWSDLTVTPLRDSSGNVTRFICMLRDITVQRQLQDQLQHQALHDPLTGLSNRLGLSQHLNTAIARSIRNKTTLILGVIDLDDFKPVNDIWGHRAGDTLLKEFARRLQSQLRAPDYLARFGGDEFIIVLEDCGGERAIDHLSAIADRLHTVVEVPFNIMPGQFATVDMSMGVALCPSHGDNPDALLRQADAALYQSKTHKRDRTRWWAVFAEPALADGPALAFDRETSAYGAEAAKLLEPLQDMFQTIILEFVVEFYHNLHQRREATATMAQLNTEEFVRLKKNQGDYLAKMLSPSLSATEHSKSAMQLGRMHALIGLSTTEIVLAMQDYINLVHLKIHGLTLRPEQRSNVTEIINARFKQELRLEIEGMSQVDDARQSLLMNLELQAATWAQDGVFIPSALQTLMDGLDGLAGVWYGGADTDMTLVADTACGCTEAYFADLMNAGVEFSFDRADPNLNQSSAVRAWLSGEVITIPNYAVDPGLATTLPIARKHGIRSAATVPVFDRDGNPACVVSLFGKYPCQFESWQMQLWLRSLQQFFQRHFLGDTTVGVSAVFISKAARVHYRQLLHDGGLKMYMQPIIDFHTGKIVKVEALARLQDDTIVLAPDRFLRRTVTRPSVVVSYRPSPSFALAVRMG